MYLPPLLQIIIWLEAPRPPVLQDSKTDGSLGLWMRLPPWRKKDVTLGMEAPRGVPWGTDLEKGISLQEGGGGAAVRDTRWKERGQRGQAGEAGLELRPQ